MVYCALEESGELETSLDAAVRSMQGSLKGLVSKLREKGYTEPEAHDRAWESLLRNWPFKMDDGEPEKKESPEPFYGPIMPVGTAGNGNRDRMRVLENFSEYVESLMRAVLGATSETTKGRQPPSETPQGKC
jgi:hypothetical protein